MIDAIAAVCMFALFAVWQRNDWYNATIKMVLLFLALALAFEALREFGYIVSIG